MAVARFPPTPERQDSPRGEVMNSTRFMVALIMNIGLGTEMFAQIPVADSSFVPGEVYVQFIKGVSLDNTGKRVGSKVFDELAERYNFSSVNKSFPFLDRVARKTDAISALERIYTVNFEELYSPEKVASALSMDPNIVYAEPNFIHYIQGKDNLIKPNDPLFESRQMKYFELLQLPTAWEITKGEQGDALIAIVDDGVYWKHEDLMANVWRNPGEVPSNGIDDDQNGYVDDVHGYDIGHGRPYDPKEFLPPNHGEHGTAVASMAVAVTNNGIGMAGSSWNARFISVGVSCGSGLCSTYEGIAYAATHGADIINASFSTAGYSKTGAIVIQAVTDMGALIVAGAGNDGINLDRRPLYPASYPRVLTVGATSNDYDTVVFNYGTNVDVYAAGRDVISIEGDGYSRFTTGTSFATPLVSGIAALVKTAFPNYDADQIREQIRFTADPIDYANVPEFEGLLGFGRVNAFKAVTETGIAGTVFDTMEVDFNSGRWRLGTTGDVNVTVHSYLEGTEDLEVRIVEAPNAYDFARRVTAVGSVPSGTSKTVSFPFTVANSREYRGAELFVFELRTGTETSREAIISPIENWEIDGVSSEKLTFDVTSEGNIGFLDQNRVWLEGFSRGRGIFFKEIQHLLFESGVILGTGPNQVSRTVKGIEYRNNVHFIPKPNSGLKIRAPGNITPWEAEVTLLDTKAPNPTGMEVLQEIYFDPESRNSGFAILRYTVTNPSSSVVNNLHIGQLFDWVISENWFGDIPGYDLDRGVGYQYAKGAAPVMGAMVLTDNAKHHFTVYNSNWPYPFPRSESAWWFISGGVNPLPSTTASYWGHVFGAGPYTVLSDESVEAAFAFLGGDSIDDMLLNADRAQDFWDSHFTSKARAQFLQIDSEAPLDLYVNGQLTIEDWQPEVATKFLPMEFGDSVVELRKTGSSKKSDPLVSARVDFDPTGRYQVVFFGNSKRFMVAADARRVAVSENKVEFRVVHGITDVADLELRVLDGDSHGQIRTLQVSADAVSGFTELEPGSYAIQLWDPLSNVLLGTYNLDADLFAGRSFVLVMSGSASSGVNLKSFCPDGTELGSVTETNTVTFHTFPSELVLHGNYPNPFNTFTQIRFDLPVSAHITVEVMDMIGRLVWEGSKEYMEAGYNRQYQISGDGFASGIYLYRLLADAPSGKLAQSGRIVLVR